MAEQLGTDHARDSRSAGDPASGGAIDWLGIAAPDGLERWEGTDGELRALLDRLALVPWTGSPAVDLAAGGQALATGAASAGRNDALRALAQPDLLIELVHVPPAGTASARFYGRADTDWYVCHWERDDRHHVWWPFRPEWLTRFAGAVVETDRLALPVEFAVGIDRAGFEALVGLVDLLQEGAMVALLDGRPAPAPVVRASDVAAVFGKSRSDHDLRWMIPRAHRLAPVPLDPDRASAETALASLARAGWLTHEHGGYAPSDTTRMACALLADARGWWAVTRRVRRTTADGGVAWQAEHAAAMRGLDSLWAFTFENLSVDGFTVRVRDTDAAGVTALAERLFVRPAAEPAPAARAEERRPIPPPLPPERTSAETSPVEWFYARDRQTVGPVAESELRRLVASGVIVASTQVWNASMTAWATAAAAGLVVERPAGKPAPPRPQVPAGPPPVPAGEAAPAPPAGAWPGEGGADRCPKCGHELRRGAAFCTRCGHRIG